MACCGAACALACGERPDAPGRALFDDGPSGEAANGAGSASGSLDRPSQGAEPEAPAPDPPEDEPVATSADAGLSPAPPDDPDDTTDPEDDDDGDDEPLPSVQAALACTEDGGSCLIVNIALVDVDEDSCIQLTLDDCESSSQPGLPIDLPVSWRLGSAAILRSSDDCVPGAQFDPASGSTIIDASGSISWNLMTRVPSELVLDVTLQPSVSAINSAPIRVTNSDLVDPLIECD